MDSAKHPWTLDNPAHGWFGLSSCARIRVGEQTRAVAVAEVVAPTETAGGARDLMVALVRAGVTATCSAADRPRYGHLEVDSNLPDARIALGGPDDNAFTAAVLAAADPAYAAEVKRQLAQGQARVFVPAARDLDAVWVPDADLRGVLELPVLIVAGDGAVEAVVSDLDDAEIAVAQDVPADCGEFQARTVALINRGVPGFAVERDGTLHASLMRSCTGWPSGVWIDPPQRKAPDGSNFQLQHWTHSFDFALVSGSGDWRHIGMPSRSAEFNHPLTGVAITGGSAGLAADGSLLSIEPAGVVALGALKAAGNPTAVGSATAVDAADVTVRLVETLGAPARARIATSIGSVTEVSAADLLEVPRRSDGDPLDLHGYQIATLATHFDAEKIIDASGEQLAPDAEPAQPSTPATGCTTVARPRWAACPPSRTCILRPSPPDPANRYDCDSPWPATAAMPPSPERYGSANPGGGRRVRPPGCGRRAATAKEPSICRRVDTATPPSPSAFPMTPPRGITR